MPRDIREAGGTPATDSSQAAQAVTDASEQHRDELVNAVAAAVAALTKAEQVAGVWADDVSATVEEQLGVGPSDPKRFEDPIYARNLRLISAIREAREAIERINVP